MPVKATSVLLPTAIKQQMLEHALSSSDEVCGLLGGRQMRICHYYPVENIAPEARRRFYMSPQGQLDAMQMMRQRDEQMLGIFHSHPDAPALPSATDLELNSYSGVIQFIVSLQDKSPKLKSFRYEGDNFSRIAIRETPSPE